MPTYNDMFSREVAIGGAFSADGAAMTFGSFTAGILAQSITWTYQQAITRLYEVASSNIYLVAGRTQGQSVVQRILGPTALSATFYSTFGNVCNIATNTINFTAAAKCGVGGAGSTSAIQLTGCVIQSYGGSVQAQDMVVNEQITLMFLWLTYTSS